MNTKMKSQESSILFFGFLLSLILICTGCTSKPDKSQIEQAVRAELKNNIPVSWVGNMMGGRNAKITTVEIVEWGTYNKNQKYWPVKIRVVGSAELNDPFNQGKVKRFDKTSEFRLRKDEYGKWQASLSGGMFQ